MSTIQVTLRGKDKGKGLFVADILDWDEDSEGGSIIHFRDNRDQIIVTDTDDSIKTKIDAALARPAGAVAGASYTITNDITDRTFDANTAVDAEQNDVLATLIRDLAAAGIIQVA